MYFVNGVRIEKERVRNVRFERKKKKRMLTHVMKILYVANVRMPTEKAHGIQIAKTCEAFVKAGADVELVVPDRATHIKESVAEYYGLKNAFPVTRLRVPDIVSWGFVGFMIESLVFALAAAREARRRDSLVYGRDEIVLAAVTLFTNCPIVWESHTGAWNILARYVSRRAKEMVVITGGLRDFYVDRGVPSEKIHVAHDGLDRADFEHAESKEDARARLGLPRDMRIALYIGALGGWKGTDTLFEASEFLPDTVRIAVIGGTQDQIARARKKFPRVLFLGEKPYRDIARNQAAADVLVLPNTGKDVISVHFTSPLKLFTYMASDRPIVASDIPSTREVLPEGAAFWFVADDAESLAEAIQKAQSDPNASEKVSIAKSQVLLYTWDARARAILAKI